MENATKALVIAGGVLISIIIISMLLLVVNSLTNYQELNTQQEETNALAAFNNQYIPYNRDDVRGNELLTLANKVIDYNERKSTETTNQNSDFLTGYQPISLKIKYYNEQDTQGPDGKRDLFTKTEYEVSNRNGNTYTINNLREPFDKIKDMAMCYPSEQVLDDLATGYTKIFCDKKEDFDDNDYKKIKTAVTQFNTCYGQKLLGYSSTTRLMDTTELDNAKYYLSGTWDYNFDARNQRNLKEDVCRYSEYKQFKRARFKCTNFEYDKSTGRVSKLEFEFTGEIN